MPGPIRSLLLALIFSSVLITTVHASYELKISPFFKETYDDNVLLAGRNEIDDFIHLSGVSLDLGKANHFYNCSIHYTVETETYQDNDWLYNVGHFADANLKFQMPFGFQVQTTDRFLSTEDFDLSPEALETTPFSIALRQKKIGNDFFSRISRPMGGRSVLYVDVKNFLEDVERPSDVDRNTTTFETGIDYQWGRMHQHTLNVGIEKKIYAFEKNTPGSPKKTYESTALRSGCLLDISVKSDLTVYGEVIQFLDSNHDMLHKDGYFIAGGISYVYKFRNIRPELSYDRQLSGSGWYGELVDKNIYSLSVSSYLTPKLNASVKADFQDHQYSRLNSTEKDRDSRIFTYTIDLNFDINERANGSVECTFYSKEYDRPEAMGASDYDQYIIESELEYSFFEHLILRGEYRYVNRNTQSGSTNIDQNSFEQNRISISIVIDRIGFGSSRSG